jgi:hypothetical protein
VLGKAGQFRWYRQMREAFARSTADSEGQRYMQLLAAGMCKTGVPRYSIAERSDGRFDCTPLEAWKLVWSGPHVCLMCASLAGRRAENVTQDARTTEAWS